MENRIFIISGNWAEDPVDVHNAPFPPFTNPIGRLRPEGMFSSQFFFFFSTFNRLTVLFIDAAVIRPRLDKFYLDRIDSVRAFPGRTFHDLVTLSRLAAWGLGPLPTAENLSLRKPLVEVSIVHSTFPFALLFLFVCFFFF